MLNKYSHVFGFIPIFLGIGILAHSTDIEMLGMKWYIVGVFLLIVHFFGKRNFIRKISLLLFLLCFIAIGWFTINKRIEGVEKVSVTEYEGLLQGEVVEVSNKDQKLKLLLQNVVLLERNKQILKGVSLLLQHKCIELQPGDRVELKVKLDAHKQDNLPGTFNFTLYAFFKGINAVGHSLSNVQILQESKNNHLLSIDNIRQKINNSFYDTLVAETADIAVAFFLGNTKNINKDIFNNIRIVGLAHLLAISGMHIALFAGMIFLSSNFLLSGIQNEFIRMNINKIIAVITALTTFCYLLLAQAPISAQRAFIMTLLLLIGVLIDRRTHPQRTITIAAIVILLTTPEAVLFPGFQMSFAASIGLICGFGILQGKKLQKYINQYGRYTTYCVTIILSSVIATLTTSIYIFYHFKSFSAYAILANLIAIPITEFFIMPFGLVGILLLPINLEFLGYYPMELGIKALLVIAENIARLPHAEIKIKHIPAECLLFFTLGLAYLIIVPRRFKKYCLIFFLIAVIEYTTYVDPDVVISKSGKLVAVKDSKDAKLFFVRNLRQNYLSRIWRENMQFKKISKKELRQYCGGDFCYFKSYQLYILFNKNGLKYMDGIKQQETACINLSGEQIDGRREFRFYLGQSDLAAKGAHKIWLADDKVRIEYARSKLIK